MDFVLLGAIFWITVAVAVAGAEIVARVANSWVKPQCIGEQESAIQDVVLRLVRARG